MTPLFDFARIHGATSGHHSHIALLRLLVCRLDHLLQLSMVSLLDLTGWWWCVEDGCPLSLLCVRCRALCIATPY